MFTKALAKKKESGFSLVELMVVVGIIGILASLAMPKFTMFQAKARQAEAKGALSQLFTLQESYFSDNDTYTTDTAALGFSVTGTARYAYAVTAATASTWDATATESGRLVFPCATNQDVWSIDETRTITNSTPGGVGC